MAIRAVKHSWGGGKGAWYELNRAEPGPWVRDGDKNDSRAGRKRERRPAGRVRDRGEGEPLERCFTPLPIAGRTWACMRAGRLCSLFPLRGPGGSSPFPFSVASRSGSAVSGLLCLGDLSCRQAGLPYPRLRSQPFFHTRRGWLRGCPSAVPAGSEYPSAGFAAPCF